MWIRLLGVFILLMLGIWTTIGSATSAPSEAPLAQATTAVPTNTLPVPTTAVPTNTPQPTATLMPSPTGTATLIPTATQSGLVDLTISKVGSADPVNTGDQLTYTITVFNSSTFSGGTSPATTVIDSVPSGTVLVSTPSGGGGCSNSGTSAGSIITCNVPALGPNQSIAFTLIVQVIAGSGTVITNSATVDPNNNVQEINESNNTATLNTTVGLTPVPTSTVAPAASATAVTAGTPITVIETAIPGPTPRAEGTTLWVQILQPTQVYSVTDDPLWTAVPGELYWVEQEQPGWLLVVWEGDSKAWSVWIADDARVQRQMLTRAVPPDAGDLWLVAFGSAQAYFEDMSPAWLTSAGEWYFVLLRQDGWALVRYEFDPPNIVVWIQEGPGVEYTFFDAPHQPG